MEKKNPVISNSPVKHDFSGASMFQRLFATNDSNAAQADWHFCWHSPMPEKLGKFRKIVDQMYKVQCFLFDSVLDRHEFQPGIKY